MRSRVLSRRLLVPVVVVGAGVLYSGCAIGFPLPASDRTATTATLNSLVYSTRSDDEGEWWFRYGKTTTYDNETPHRSVVFANSVPVSEPISGLDPDTTYHYVSCAVDQEPGVGPQCSGDQTFRTRSTGTRDSLVVTGSTFGFSNIDIDVSSGPSGENPTGHASADSSQAGHLEASAITCLYVIDGRAAISGPLEPNPGGYTFFEVVVQDDGPANSGLDHIRLLASTGPYCSLGGSLTLVLSDGDAVVVDAPADPPSE